MISDDCHSDLPRQGFSTHNNTSSQPPNNQNIPSLLPDDSNSPKLFPPKPRLATAHRDQSGNGQGSVANISSYDGYHTAFQQNYSTLSNGSFQPSGSQNIPGSLPDQHIHPRRQRSSHSRNTVVQLASAASTDFSSIFITLDRLPKDIATRDIWDSLVSNNLSITRIDLLENSNGERTGKAKVCIAPPPSRWPPWSGPPNVCVINRKDSSALRVPIVSTLPNRAGSVKTPNNRYIPREANFTPKSLLFGMLAHESAMFDLPQYEYQNVGMNVKFFKKSFEIKFSVNLGRYGIKDLMMRIEFSHVKRIIHATCENGEPALVILLPSPPKFYCLMPVSHDDTQSLWQEWDLWARQIDITDEKRNLKDLPARLEKPPGESVDIGRWTAYYLGMTPASLSLWERIASYLSDYNIKTKGVTDFRLITPDPTNIWRLLDSSVESLSLEALHSGHSFHLPFEVRYQLEVCISHGLFNEYNIGVNFLEKLNAFETERARMMLEGVAEANVTFYDPMKIFEDHAILNYWPNARVPSHAALVRRAVVTPTTIYFQTPCVELTNRILRKYSDLNDRFLRVQFTDEITFGKIYSSPQNSKKDDNLYVRVHRVMSNGIVVGDRCYRFLAFSNSQFRDNGAFFFCDTDHVTCESIRSWMGDFQHIRSVGKFAARMGQCFTTTRQVAGISVPKIQQIADIERRIGRHVWNFTDGIGKISSFLASMIANDRDMVEVPSCYQMRMGGCKGVVVVWPNVPPNEIHIRPSQEKFKAVYNGLEIIKTSSYSHATLNRQIIPILSALGVDDNVFEEMLNEELREYVDGLADPFSAGELLRSRVDENQTTLTMAEMVDTFMDTNEPFLKTLLDLWKFWTLRRLKYKAAISVKESAMVYGVVDEVGVLRGHSEDTEGKGYNRIESLPQIFLQVPVEAWDGSFTTNYKVITGLCVVGRNPSLHAGDVRVVQAVDVPQLRHLKNVVVFPQTGDRDIPSMCSGGDLDGDDYFVFWDKRLIPTEWNHLPMYHDDNSGNSAVDGAADVSIEDIIRFFAQYMKNDSLGAIATAHFAQADQVGVKHSKCIDLAKLHSKAVDYIKSGNPAVMAKHLRPRRWPHWMEKEPKYKSKSAVGRIYDCMCIKTENMEWHTAYDKPFDKRILTRYHLDADLLAKASEIKAAYDTAMRRLMGQHEAPVTEAEIWSTFILSKPRVGSDYKLQENVGREVSSLKGRFRAVCIEAVTGVEQKQSYVSTRSMVDLENLNQFVAAMYTVTYDQVRAALRQRATPQLDADGEVVDVEMPLISFPWLFHRELARVALGHGGHVRPLVRPTWAGKSPLRHRDGQDEVGSEGKDVPQEEGVIDKDMKKTQLPHEVRSKKEGSSGYDNDNEDVGEDYVRTSSGKIIHRGQVLDLFAENVEGVVGSQDMLGTTASIPSVEGSHPEMENASDTLDRHYPGSSDLASAEFKHDDVEEEEEYLEVEYEEVDVSIEEEEDALERLVKKVEM
ncbi:RNA-dependent RNA polymerase 1 [Cytospora mali]|uniref:RNA-dependent RNA polymerase n=1 Tax=Cytospora mali TaxID=578113 RepID=A0A194V7M4_CYTMA|nr:RNA-dependent RNA polymerase 1 [Valsa mali var. pyri (nom. inval.)]